jgi:poly-gamma-glutamate synthesis protein (capsule biosynthesis protein)
MHGADRKSGADSIAVLRFARFFLLLLILSFYSCASSPRQSEPDSKTEETITPTPPTREEVIPVVQDDYITIVATGDNLLHVPILRACFKDGEYNFNSIYDKIKEYILPADIAFVNQETILGNSVMGYSGYPLFSSPPEIGAALAAAGFNIVNHATNHIMDKGEAGILSSIAYWDTIEDVEYLGIYRSEEERNNRRIIVNKNNFKVGFLSYTYGTNGIPLPAGKSYMVSLIEPGKMAVEIDALRPLCDYLVVSMHWGVEYQSGFSREQERLAAFLAEHGVDLVIGHHPHVLEPYAAMRRPDGGIMHVFYSLGNFLSAHATPVKETLLGGLMYVRLKKSQGEISVDAIGLIPLITHFNVYLSGFCIYPLSDYTEDLATQHWNRARDREMTLAYFAQKAQELFGPALILPTGNF